MMKTKLGARQEHERRDRIFLDCAFLEDFLLSRSFSLIGFLVEITSEIGMRLTTSC
jgi:hypothetical protein